MSTYTDLHNRVKENITVDYNNRITPQEVKFLNENNEFWGTLKGHVSAEGIAVTGGILKNVTLENATFAGEINLGGDVDLRKVEENIGQLSTDLINIKDLNKIEHDTFNTKFGNHATSLECLSGLVAKLDREKLDSAQATNSFTNITKDFNRSIDALSDDTFKAIDALSDDTFKAIDTLSDDTFKAIDTLSDDTFKAIDALSIEIFNTTDVLSSEIDILTLKFGEEVHNRVAADEKINNKIDNEVEKSINRDTQLSNKIDEHKKEHDVDILNLTNEIHAKIEHDKHYSIVVDLNGARLTDSYPFASKDFAVNVYKATIKNGTVEYTDELDRTYLIGEIFYENKDVIFKTFSKIENVEIADALRLNYTYRFTENSLTVPAKDGSYYNIEYSPSNQKITLLPVQPSFNALMNGANQIGKVYDVKKENGNILSGKLYINTDDSALSIFNKFQDTVFNTTDLSLITNESEQLEYFGNNTFRFSKNVKIVDYIPVNDKLDSNKYEFARILKPNNTDLQKEINITLTYLAPDEQTASLKEANGFKSIVKANQSFGNKEYDLVLSANVIDNTAAFDVIEVSELYKYSFDGANSQSAGYIVPVQFNKTLNESKNFNKLSVEFIDAFEVAAFNKSFELTINDGIWDCEEKIDNNVINIKFGGDELRVKITVDNGSVAAYIFKVKINESEIYNVSDCHNHIYTSEQITLEYTESIPNIGDSYNISIDPISQEEKMSVYEMFINNTDNNILKICIPERTTNDISREFIIVIKPTSSENKLVELQLTDNSGSKVEYIANRRNKLLIPTNIWTNLQVNEINHNKFYIKDFDGNEATHDFRILSATIDNVRTSLSTEIDTLSTTLSNEVIALSISLSNTVDQICANISTDLSSEIENSIVRYNYLSNEILSNDNDIAILNNKVEFLLSVDKESMVYKGTLPHLSNISIDSIDQGYCYLTAFINGRKGIQLDGILKQGDFFKLSADQEQIIDQKDNSFYLGKNDYFVINKDVAISDITIDDIDIFRNAESEVTQLSINLFNKIEADDLALSTSLSNTVDQICANISTDLLSEIEKNNNRYVYLSDEISSNDDDIKYLSSEISSLSVNLSTDLSSEIELRKALNTRYTNSFVSTKDIGANEHISSDRLILTDEIEHIEGSTNEHKQYYMTFEAGTLVLKPLTK